ncbi:hypothetical protein [Brevundimonas guildfordensis]|uniref:Uncharacterized protein n=1 Tax=Brevundimonas guildfordensis TaxID=2762241 RepID=A0ABR8R0T0_9CAUL|nr:hypothetical protein [Brevundimonas guildfordensis]MBD7941386.1 hypothetical protein [Brevundimonas guildfordensis]
MPDIANIYLFSSESKDRYCLSPLESALAKFGRVGSVSIDRMCSGMEQFATDCFPLAVFSSLSAFYAAKFIRGDRRFVALGMEHGAAPFKGYTYDPHFLNYDCYVSPTEMWAERLRLLYPGDADKFLTSAYPRLDDLKARIDQVSGDPHGAWSGAPALARDLVIFSWGANLDALTALPDRAGIVYLVHPSMRAAAERSRLERARVVVSAPDSAAKLIAEAHSIYGDFSSMTLEAAVLKQRTFMFLDRDLYTSDCDLKASFFDRSSSDFGVIEHAGFRLPADDVLDVDGLFAALNGGQVHVQPVVAWAPLKLLPKLSGQESARAASVVGSLLGAIKESGPSFAAPHDNMIALKAVERAYRDVLGRGPDYPAALTHARAFAASAAPLPVKTLNLYSSFGNSAEAQRRWNASRYRMPRISIELDDA